MAHTKDAFEARLERLGQPGAQPTAARPAAMSSPARKAKRQEGPPVGLLIVAVSVLLLGASAFGVMLMAPQLVFGDPNAFVSETEEEKTSAVIENITPTALTNADTGQISN